MKTYGFIITRHVRCEKTNKYFANFLTISKIEVTRINQDNLGKEYVNIIIHSLFPRAKEMSRKVTKYFSENIENLNPKTLSLLNNSKGHLKPFTTLLLRSNIFKLIT